MAISTWIIDPTHSAIQFQVKQSVVVVNGAFMNYKGAMTAAEPNFSDASIHFEMEVNSINTNFETRDEHLRTADFFDASTFPTVTFDSTSFTPKSNDQYELVGNLTIRGITIPVRLDVTYGGTVQDRAGKTIAGFELNGVIKRKDFGMTYNALMEKGELALGEDIKIHASVQLIQQA
ncbi:polyisoprenoid-binding protein YceI [Chitinophaga skermanii]|uniref:Polyisoprenoid-binding protein YceI n=1 Tax=Chitinophaga skermanii TaxID=331697 RepID=A0A327QXR3_9BACT|nr:YceI family protein [Chitinophaga skermanii]RAJ08568.1 polyisoprenoid-binding protein YceI [Chitinophaga skermanii]